MNRTLCSGGWAIALMVIWTGSAFAQDWECETDSDCGLGRACEVFGSLGCPDSPPCPMGEACPEPPPCESREFSRCVPGPCSDDAGCPDSERCVTETWTECDYPASGQACKETEDGLECEVIEPDPIELEDACKTVTQSTCRPPWQGQCDQASDCGPGFTCEQAQSCWCTGSGVATPADDTTTGTDGGSDMGHAGDGDMDGDGDPGAPSAPPELVAPPESPEDVQCGCDPVDEHYCQLIDTPCESDGDCDTGLTCQDWAISMGGCTRPPTQVDGPEDAGVAEAMPEAEPEPQDEPEDKPQGGETDPVASDPIPTEPWGCDEEVETVVHRRCMPPNYWGVPLPFPGVPGGETGSGGGTGATMDPASAGDGTVDTNEGPPTDNAPEPPETSMPNGDGDDADGEADGEADGDHGHWGSRRHHRRFRPWLFCSASPGASGDSGLAALLGLPALMLLRRRRQRG